LDLSIGFILNVSYTGRKEGGPRNNAGFGVRISLGLIKASTYYSVLLREHDSGHTYVDIPVQVFISVYGIFIFNMIIEFQVLSQRAQIQTSGSLMSTGTVGALLYTGMFATMATYAPP
jgi:hypothetical protein